VNSEYELDLHKQDIQNGKPSFMQSETEDFPAEIEEFAISKRQLRSYDLYEEYSKRNITTTIQTRKDAYEKADAQAREELETETEIEVENFHIWLELIKKLSPFAAHYYSVSLKSLLLGFPIGENVAQLFEVVLEKVEISQQE
jgi:hypothetical protein